MAANQQNCINTTAYNFFGYWYFYFVSVLCAAQETFTDSQT